MFQVSKNNIFELNKITKIVILGLNELKITAKKYCLLYKYFFEFLIKE